MEIMIVNAQQQVKKVNLEWGGNFKVESGDSIRLANKIDMKSLRKGNDLILQNGKGQEFVLKDFYLKGKKGENQLLSWDDELGQEREISTADNSDSAAVATEDTTAANNSAAADQSAEAGAAKSQDSGKAAGWMTTENGEPGALPVLGGILALGAIALTLTGGGGSSGSGSSASGSLTPAQLALQKIVDYANDNTKPAPTVEDYATAGVTGVTAATLPAVNPAVDAVTGAEVDTVAELQALIDAALAAQAAALAKIVAYANDNTNPAPTVADYVAAGATGVTATTLPAVNPAVDAVTGLEVDTLPELQAVIDAALAAQTAALQKIVDYANDNTKPAPTVADYAAAGVTGVTDATLPTINSAVDSKVGTDVDTVPELQGVIDAALAAKAAMDKIVAYANDNTNPAPTVADYVAAGATGVDATTLTVVNPAVDAKVGVDVDTLPELQAVIDAALAAAAAQLALQKIVDYANDNTKPIPTVEDYATAGATGVTATTLPAVNPAVDAVTGAEVDTLPELQAVIDAALAAQTAALAKIVAYANDNTNPAPTVADYVAAGATGVDATTLPLVNPAVDAKVGVDVDTLPELQAVIDAALAVQAAALQKIVDYANDNTKPIPTVEDYAAAGATGVTATTLTTVNPAVDAVTGLEVDTLPELQALIDAALAAQAAALQKIVDYANDNTKPIPTVADYATAGATGVTATTLPAVNPAVDAVTGAEVDTVAELQAVIDAALAAQTAALAKIVAYANDNTKPAPTVADYAAAGATGVDATTLPLVNPAVDAKVGVDVDTLPELQAVIDAALAAAAAQLALQKIVDYANDNTNPIPTVADYTAAGVTGVDPTTIPVVNPAVDAKFGSDVDTVPELQAVINAALAAQAAALQKIVDYANDPANPIPTVADYTAAGVTGVDATTLPVVNPAVEAVTGLEVDTQPELQAVINAALAAQAAALQKIVDYANDPANPIPTVEDYAAAGVTGVDATTLPGVNPAVDAKVGVDVDTQPELQAVIDAALASFGLPTATLSQYRYDANTETLTLMGTNWNTILEIGEDPATTNVASRLNWDKLSFDVNGDNPLGSPSTTEYPFGPGLPGETFNGAVISGAYVNAAGTELTVTFLDWVSPRINPLTTTVDMQAGFVEDGAGNLGTNSIDNAPSNVPQTFDLGAYGKLINPVMVEGKFYYYWDRTGDGTVSNNNFVLDPISGQQVSTGSMFTEDTVVLNQLGNEMEYAFMGDIWTMNGVTVRLPTIGAMLNYADRYDPDFTSDTGAEDTTIYQTLEANYLYNDLLALGDQFNGMPEAWAWPVTRLWSSKVATLGVADGTTYWLLFGKNDGSGFAVDSLSPYESAYMALEVIMS